MATKESSPARYSVRTVVTRWLLGAVIASLLVGLVCPFFLSSLRVYEWCPELDDYVMKDGYVHRKRDEGWASTHYGPYGFNRMAGMVDTNSLAVMIWGDSFVEAHQVSDEYKTVCQVNKTLSEQGLPYLRALSVGRACWSVSDYYFKIPRYESLVNPVCHFIVVAEGGLKDLCPDEVTFLSKPAPRLVQRFLVDSTRSRVITDLYEWGLSDALLAPWRAVRTLSAEWRKRRFSLGPRADADSAATVSGCNAPFTIGDPNVVLASWDFVLDALKSTTDKPIVLVLVPTGPHLEHGVISCADPQMPWRARLADLCQAKHIGCIDMTETLIDDYQWTGKLSRGTNNGLPDAGHLNVRGQWLLSQAICSYLTEHRDNFRKTGYAVHTD
jgi:hypothetical protein